MHEGARTLDCVLFFGKYFMREIWKDIKGYEGLYKISNHGRVKSLKRIGRLKDRILKTVSKSDGYISVCLCNGNIKYYRAHQLVARTFLNHVSFNHKYVVDHIDFDKANNHASNLRIVTVRENTNRKHIKSTSKYTGVHWNKRDKKWRASIHIDGTTKNLGGFKIEEEAAQAYETALAEVAN